MRKLGMYLIVAGLVAVAGIAVLQFVQTGRTDVAVKLLTHTAIGAGLVVIVALAFVQRAGRLPTVIASVVKVLAAVALVAGVLTAMNQGIQAIVGISASLMGLGLVLLLSRKSK